MKEGDVGNRDGEAESSGRVIRGEDLVQGSGKEEQWDRVSIATQMREGKQLAYTSDKMK